MHYIYGALEYSAEEIWWGEVGALWVISIKVEEENEIKQVNRWFKEWMKNKKCGQNLGKHQHLRMDRGKNCDVFTIILLAFCEWHIVIVSKYLSRDWTGESDWDGLDRGWRIRTSNDIWRKDCRNEKMSNVTSGSSVALAELSHRATLLSSVREARGTSANSSCQGAVESMCLEEVRDFDFF